MKNKIWYGGKCKCCKGINEPYMVTNDIWNKVAGHQSAELICLACFEKKLGRKLKLKDFTAFPINNGMFGFEAKKYVKRGKRYLDAIKKQLLYG